MTDELVQLRRDLHAHPELGFEERRTAGIVAARLRAAGIEVAEGIGGTGVVGRLTRGEGRAVLLRADMDALAMSEAPGRPWQSTAPGKMHACGHDGHTVMLLGAAERLAREGGFAGTVQFVFQPAEEGRGGAKAMLADGLLARFPATMAFGLHNMPGLAPDQVAVVEGPQLASSDSWEVVLTGTGTHGAKPHLGRDALTAAGQFLSALPAIVAREVDPLDSAVVSACALSAGDFRALNVIPPEVRIGGTARAYRSEVRDLLQAAIGRIAQGVAASAGIAADYRFIRRIPPVVNDPLACAPARRAAERAGRLLTRFPPSTAGDDFAWFAGEIPGCYVWLGNGPAVEGALHHNPAYDFCDAAIPTGVAFWVALVREVLSPGPTPGAAVPRNPPPGEGRGPSPDPIRRP